MHEDRMVHLKKYYKKLFIESLNDLKTKSQRARQIPNILTVMRLFAPFFIIPAAFIHNVNLIFAFVLFFSITDALDGFIARKYNFVSELGKDLDAVCDKAFAITLLIAASFFEPILVLNFLLELAIASVNMKAKINDYNTNSHIVGKIKTCFLYPLIGIGLLNVYMESDNLFLFMFFITTIMQVVTTIVYMFRYRDSEAYHREQY